MRSSAVLLACCVSSSLDTPPCWPCFEDIAIVAGDEKPVEFHGTVVWFQSAEEIH